MEHRHKWQFAEQLTLKFAYDVDESLIFVCECGKLKKVKES